MTDAATGLPRRPWYLALIPIAAIVAASVLGQMATFPHLAPWYAGLSKPPFNPPNWVFGPAWTTLYVLMAFATIRVIWQPESAARTRALVLFALQLLFNIAWSWMFFAAENPLLGLINIVPQLALVIATVLVFYRVDRTAGIALAPLALWVSFATLLNVSVWWLNR
ncbi:TspO/MBR family protein [Undibacter mobilis]|uniref:Tryptophan-rich sensory protein n=1 Tax=Undibacter mobilis TaxID=2292256 RepID=A0A371B0U6_9BRAD|nr:TspO/MBR family protein [Undibacter mobilis]RDV01196.1 tryptophan-rich sensory protein [Undibacter mobilis]